jgi:hypothetical protein
MSNFGRVAIRNVDGSIVVGLTDPDGDGVGGLDVYIQDQYTQLLNYLLIIESNTTTLQSATIVDTRTFVVPTGTVSGGDVVNIGQGQYFYQAAALSVAVASPNDTVTVDLPFDHAFTAGAPVQYGSPFLNVDGSSTRVVAELAPPPGVSWDIVYWALLATNNAVMDSTTFAGETALTNGVVLRKRDGEFQNLGIAKTNGDLDLVTDLTYLEKVPSGTYAMIAEGNLRVRTGVTLRLDGASGEKMEVVIQDDLTGITSMVLVAQGHKVE